MKPSKRQPVVSGHEIPTAGLGSLSPDLLILIIEELYSHKHGIASLRILRLVSRSLNTAAIPFIYQSVKFTPSLVNTDPLDRARNKTRRRVWANIRACVKHAQVCQPWRAPYLNWNHVIKLLAACKQLQSITYRYRLHTVFTSEQFPRALKNSLQNKWQRLQFHINGYRFREIDSASIPVSSVTSFRKLKTTTRARPAAFTEFLIKGNRLESLHLVDSQSLEIPKQGRKLPPVKTLKMSSYTWTHTAQEVLQIWDFSNLEVLVFTNGQARLCEQFLLSVQPESLRRLKKFKYKTFSGSSQPKRLSRITAEFIARLPSVQKLAFDCYIPETLVPSIAKCGHDLRLLKLHDEYLVRDVHLSDKDVEDIVNSCPKLTLLAFESSISESKHLDLYQNLAKLRSLHRVEITTRLDNYSQEGALQKAQFYVTSIRNSHPGVSTKIEMLHFLMYDESDKRVWRLKLSMTRNSFGGNPPLVDLREPTSNNDVLSGTHYC